MKNAEQYVTIWSKSPSSSVWMVERSHPLWYATQLLGVGLNETTSVGGRTYTMTSGEIPEQLFA